MKNARYSFRQRLAVRFSIGTFGGGSGAVCVSPPSEHRLHCVLHHAALNARVNRIADLDIPLTPERLGTPAAVDVYALSYAPC